MQKKMFLNHTCIKCQQFHLGLNPGPPVVIGFPLCVTNNSDWILTVQTVVMCSSMSGNKYIAWCVTRTCMDVTCCTCIWLNETPVNNGYTQPLCYHCALLINIYDGSGNGKPKEVTADKEKLSPGSTPHKLKNSQHRFKFSTPSPFSSDGVWVTPSWM